MNLNADQHRRVCLSSITSSQSNALPSGPPTSNSLIKAQLGISGHSRVPFLERRLTTDQTTCLCVALRSLLLLPPACLSHQQTGNPASDAGHTLQPTRAPRQRALLLLFFSPLDKVHPPHDKTTWVCLCMRASWPSDTFALCEHGERSDTQSGDRTQFKISRRQGDNL